MYIIFQSESLKETRPRHRANDNIKIDLNEKTWEGVDWIHLAQDGLKWWDLVNTVQVVRQGRSSEVSGLMVFG
jgi:hypothetical protein